MLDYFEEQIDEVYENILSLDNKKEVSTLSGIFNYDKWKKRLIEISKPKFKEIIEESIKEVFKEFEIGYEYNSYSPSVKTEIGRRTKELSTFVNDNTNKRIKKILEKAEEEGLSIKEKAELIKSKFAEISISRAKRISVTETFGASNFGTYEGIIQAKIPKKMWITSRDERVRETHLIDGQVVKADEFFTLTDGRQMPYPQDIYERCIVIPYL